MNHNTIAKQNSAFATLRRLARPPAQAVQERCDLCSVALAPAHRHLLEMSRRQVVCACDLCAVPFQAVVNGKFKLIPRDPRALPDFRMTDAQWESLALPISLAFFLFNTSARKTTALYPSPAGVTESLLPLTAWEALVADNPALGRMEPDVEALLINRMGTARKYYLSPIDKCYELAGVVRLHWRGLSGGDSVWEQLEAFFTQLDAQCPNVAAASKAFGAVVEPGVSPGAAPQSESPQPEVSHA